MKYITYEEAKQKGLDFLKKYCDKDSIKEEVELPNYYFTGTLGNEEELKVIVMQFGNECIGFGIGMQNGLVMITHEPNIYIDKIIRDYENNIIKPMLDKIKS